MNRITKDYNLDIYLIPFINIINSKYYLLVGYIGGFEIHSEDG